MQWGRAGEPGSGCLVQDSQSGAGSVELMDAHTNEPHWAVGPREVGDALKSPVGVKPPSFYNTPKEKASGAARHHTHAHTPCTHRYRHRQSRSTPGMAPAHPMGNVPP